MKQLFSVKFRLATEKFPSFTESCESTVFADDYNDAANQVKQVFGSFLRFELGIIKPIGNPIVPNSKEIKQIQ